MFGSLFAQFGGRKTRSNKGVRRGSYGKRTGRTRSGRRFRPVAAKRTAKRVVRKPESKEVTRVLNVVPGPNGKTFRKKIQTNLVE